MYLLELTETWTERQTGKYIEVQRSNGEAVLATTIYEWLFKLGVTSNSKAFLHTSYAVLLCVEQQDRLLLVTKWLYPEIAGKYGTNWRSVERNIRTASAMAWRRNLHLLETLAQRSLDKPLRSAEFIDLLLRTALNSAADTQNMHCKYMFISGSSSDETQHY